MKSAYIKCILSLLIFGTNGVIAGFIDLNSYEIVFFRTLLGSMLLAVLFFSARGRINFKDFKRQVVYIAMSGVAMGASWMFLYEAFDLVGVSVATLCYYMGPVLVMILSPFIFRERLTGLKAVCFASAVAGLYFVNGYTSGNVNFNGVICGLMSAVCYAAMIISNKKATKINGIENSLLQIVAAFVTVAVFVGIKQGFAIEVEKEDVLPILVIGFLNTGFACYLYFSSIGKLPVQTVAVCGYLEPLSAVLLSGIVLNESLSHLQIVGAALILGGMLIGECSGFKAGINKE